MVLMIICQSKSEKGGGEGVLHLIEAISNIYIYFFFKLVVDESLEISWNFRNC
jgi:hypothetical protein